MAATVSIRSKFTWNKAAQRYQVASGRFVKATAVKGATFRVIKNSQAEMQRLTRQLNRGELSLSDWRSRFGAELKNLHVSGAMAGGGGMANMTQSDYGRVGQELRFQYRRLDGFTEKIRAGELTERQIEARADLYVASMNTSFEASKRSKASEVFLLEKNVLGHADKHCQSCLDETARGWVMIGTLIPPGNRSCFANCRCSLIFKNPQI